MGFGEGENFFSREKKFSPSPRTPSFNNNQKREKPI